MAKVPPPPNFASDPIFNRWLLEVTSILNGQGDIPGVEALVAAVLVLQQEIVALNTRITDLPIIISAPGVPNSILGKNGDLYVKTDPATAVYSKVSGAWVLVAS